MIPSFYILLADPNPHICRLLQRELRALPCKTEAAYTARALIEKISQDRRVGKLPDLLLFDPDMPDMRKEDLLKFLYQEISLPLIVLHSINAEERLRQDSPYANPTVLVEKNDSSPVLIKRIVEGKTRGQAGS